MLKKLIFLVLLLFFVSTPYTAKADGEWTTMHGINCSSLSHADGYLFGSGVGETVSRRDLPAFFTKLFSLQGPNIWLSSYGWNIPNYPNYGGWDSTIDITTTCGRSFIIWIWQAYSTPNMRYVFVFNSMKANTDGNGNHYGQHDFAYDRTPSGVVKPMTFAINTSDAYDLYRLLGYKIK